MVGKALAKGLDGLKGTKQWAKDFFVQKTTDKRNYNKEFDKVHGGINKKWMNDQNSANFARMQANAADTFERAAELKAEMGKVLL